MATTDEPTPLQALLALYGALDQAVIRGGPAVEATVERYLPGSTGANVGWYDELLGFLAAGTNVSSRTAEEPPAPPNLSDALTILQNQRDGLGAARPPLTELQLSRMVYALGALSQLPDDYLPPEWETSFSDTLAIAGPLEAVQAYKFGGTPPGGDDLLALLQSQFRGRNDFTHVMKYAAQHGWVAQLVAAMPQCETKAKWVSGHLCVVVTTDFGNPQVSLDQLEDVIDPLNWAKCLPVFCDMEEYPDRPDGWSRVLEHWGIICPIPQMVTPIKYWKGQGTTNPPSSQPSAWVDYALDDDPAPGEVGDGQMVVDQGFIRMTSTVGNAGAAGVRVRTKKVAGFRNLAFFPAALFACVMGYGYEGLQMMFGGVASRASNPAGWTNWTPSIPTGVSGITQPGQPGQPATGADPTSLAVALAVQMANECIDEMSKKSAAIAAKWASGVVPVAETISYTADMTARLATDPWRYMARLRNPTQGADK
jgi:hypothetical protein